MMLYPCSNCLQSTDSTLFAISQLIMNIHYIVFVQSFAVVIYLEKARGLLSLGKYAQVCFYSLMFLMVALDIKKGIN